MADFPKALLHMNIRFGFLPNGAEAAGPGITISSGGRNVQNVTHSRGG